MVEDVHIVQSKPLQALVQRGDQILAAAEVAVRAGPHLIAGLGADDQLVAMRGEIRAQQLAHVALGGTGFRPVVVGQVEVGDAVVERGPGQLAHGLERRVVAEVVPAAQRDGRQLQAAVATAVVGHRVIARGRGRIGGGRFHHGGSPSNIRCRQNGPRVWRTVPSGPSGVIVRRGVPERPVGPGPAGSQHGGFGRNHRLAAHQALRGDGQLGQGLRTVVVGGHDRVMSLPRGVRSAPWSTK